LRVLNNQKLEREIRELFKQLHDEEPEALMEEISTRRWGRFMRRMNLLFKVRKTNSLVC
jgi:hypothetical protein